MRTISLIIFLCTILPAMVYTEPQKPSVRSWPENIQKILDNTQPLTFDREKRLPLYLW